MQVRAPFDPPESASRRTRWLLKAPVVALAWLCAFALWVMHRLGVFSFLTASRLVALFPGALGILARRYWYRRTLAACGDNFVVEWLTALKTPAARVGNGVYLGSMCWVGEVDIRDNVIVGSRSALQGGGRTHGTGRLDVPMSLQPGTVVTVVIGPDVWIGTGVSVLADVAEGTAVGAGAVVTSVFPPFSVLGGVPARVIRRRDGAAAGETPDG
jgi:acetyltransferase-like isoleucine patch superfamily enzyme